MSSAAAIHISKVSAATLHLHDTGRQIEIGVQLQIIFKFSRPTQQCLRNGSDDCNSLPPCCHQRVTLNNDVHASVLHWSVPYLKRSTIDSPSSPLSLLLSLAQLHKTTNTSTTIHLGIRPTHSKHTPKRHPPRNHFSPITHPKCRISSWRTNLLSLSPSFSSLCWHCHHCHPLRSSLPSSHAQPFAPTW